jgi:hypothetical protein
MPRTAFGMTLKQSWVFGKLSGDVWEDPPHGMPGRGVIAGHLTRTGVYFLKWMPIFHVWKDGRGVPLEDYLREESGLVLDEPPPHPAIKYEGVFRGEGDELEGTWEIVPGRSLLLSQGQLLQSQTPPSKGEWTARRVLQSG